MARPSVSLPYEDGWDASPFDYDEQPRPSFNGTPHQPASVPALEPASNDITFAGAIFDNNTGPTQGYDALYDPTSQTLQSFNEDVLDGARFYDGQRPHLQNDTATAPLYNIQPPQGPTVEEVSERYAYDDDGLAPHNIGVAHHLQVPSHRSRSDADTTSQISGYTGILGTQVLTIGDHSVCSICMQRFSGKFARGNCARHIRNIHAERSTVPDPKLVCRECGKRFKRQDATVKHEKRKHSLHQTPRRRSGPRSTSRQTNDNFSDYGPSIHTESNLGAPNAVEMTRRASQQSQMQFPDRTRRKAAYRRTSQQSMPAELRAASTTAQQLPPRHRSLQPLQTPITGAADFELPSDQSMITMDMEQILTSDPGTHPSGQELYSHGFSPFMASSHTSYAPINYQAAHKNPSNYAENYAHSLEPPSPYHLEPNWSPALDNRQDILYPQQLSPSFAGLDFEPEADYSHSSSQYHGFQQRPPAL